MQKVEFNPFEILFVEFPEAFGTESLEETFNVIDDCKTRYDDYFRWIEEQAIKAIYDLWDKKRKQNLYHTLKEWYDKQGKRSKMGLYDGRMTNFMSCLEGMDVYSCNCRIECGIGEFVPYYHYRHIDPNKLHFESVKYFV